MKHDLLTIRQVLRQLEDIKIISEGERLRIWNDYFKSKRKDE